MIDSDNITKEVEITTLGGKQPQCKVRQGYREVHEAQLLAILGFLTATVNCECRDCCGESSISVAETVRRAECSNVTIETAKQAALLRKVGLQQIFVISLV